MTNTNSSSTQSLKESLVKLEDTLDLYLVKKAPFQIPDNAREVIVRFAPWISLILLVISLPAVFALFGIGALLSPFAAAVGGLTFGFNYTLGMIVTAVSLVLEALAIPGLMKRSKAGWNMVYYATLVSAVASLVRFDIVGAILGALIGLYVLFQVRGYYK